MKAKDLDLVLKVAELEAEISMLKDRDSHRDIIRFDCLIRFRCPSCKSYQIGYKHSRNQLNLLASFEYPFGICRADYNEPFDSKTYMRCLSCLKLFTKQDNPEWAEVKGGKP